MLKRLMRIAVIMFCCGGISCHAEGKHTVAEICAVVNVHGEDSKELFRMFEEFGDFLGLVIDKSNPPSTVFNNTPEENVVLSATRLGPHGVVIALYRFDKNKDLEVRDKVKTFVWRDLIAVYDVKACEDIEGFELPEIWL